MVLSIYGILVLGIGALMLILKRPLREFLVLLIVSGVFGAAEALALPMLGGSSLTVPYFCVLIVFIRLLFAARRQPRLLREALGANAWLFAFTIYAVTVAFIMPRLLEGQMAVFAMRPAPYRTLLTFTSQNITQSVYMGLTAIAATSAYVAARTKNSDDTFILGWTLATFLFALFGVIDLVSFYAGLGNLLDWLKTANYSMLSQSGNGIRRISGSFPEPSTFAGFGAGPAMFFAFLWLVDYKRTLSGILAVTVAVLLALSTSSTGFATLALLILVLGFSVMFTPLPHKVRQQKFIAMCVAFVSFFGAMVLVALFLPEFATKFLTVMESNTVNKLESQSAIERGIWAAQGFEAFHVSNGVGIGPGSFRSSGIAQAIIGSTGIVGSFCILMYVFSIARAAFSTVRSVDRRMFVACGFSAILMLAPPLISSASPDLGIFVGAMAGFALGRQKQAKNDARDLARAREADLPEYREGPAGAVIA